MGKPNGTPRDQACQLVAALATNVNWDDVPTEVAQRLILDPKGFGERCTRFLAKGGWMGDLTPTTYGSEIKPPFNGCELVTDGSDEELDINSFRLIPVLRGDEPRITTETAVNRGREQKETNWGQRAADKVVAAGNAGRFSLEDWPIGVYAVFSKTEWRNPANGNRYAWYVIRNENGFYRYYNWLRNDVNSNGRLPFSGNYFVVLAGGCA